MIHREKVSDVMTHLVVTCRAQDSVRETARRLLANRISGAPVVKDGKLVGVVSETDLLRAYVPQPRAQLMTPKDPITFLLDGGEIHGNDDVCIGDVMTKAVVTVEPDATIGRAASLIDRFGVRRLPVIDEEGFVVGVVTRSDLVRAMANEDAYRAAAGTNNEVTFSPPERDRTALPRHLWAR